MSAILISSAVASGSLVIELAVWSRCRDRPSLSRRSSGLRTFMSAILRYHGTTKLKRSQQDRKTIYTWPCSTSHISNDAQLQQICTPLPDLSGPYRGCLRRMAAGRDMTCYRFCRDRSVPHASVRHEMDEIDGGRIAIEVGYTCFLLHAVLSCPSVL